MPLPLTLADWRAAYAEPGASPRALLAPVLARRHGDDPAWILRCDEAFIETQLQRLDDALQRGAAASLPLFGVPFAVKDNIDVAGLPTTAACPAFAHTPQRHATVVQRLLDAGAVLVGKTNLDQFATGLVGTRSPYGAVPNSVDAAYVSGGSSSGSASVVARGLVAFALGTDTAGSGRVPAGFNNLVGLKPTPGALPMAGVLPACRTLDTVSVFALTVADAARVTALIEGATDEPRHQSWPARPAWFGNGRELRIGVPAQPGCDAALGYDAAFEQALEQLRAWGLQPQPVNMQPFFDVARLLYEGPWVAERYTVVRELIERSPEAIDPVVRGVIAAARAHDAAAAFDARYALEALRAQIAPLWSQLDVLMVPTAPTCPTLAAVAAEPVRRNSELGRYTNFVNLLGLAALALPSGFTPRGLPFGITFIAPGGSDAALAQLGARWEAARDLPLGAGLRDATAADRLLYATPAAAPTLQLAVVGAHLEGMPLHGQLSERGCRLIERTCSAPNYRLYALPNTQPPKPGLVRCGGHEDGQAIVLEVYEMPLDAVGSFLALIPPPLGLGSVQLADGRWVKGFICEPAALAGGTDISSFGGWRGWLENR
ncbi:allophanate hydrolase [Aquincola sp. S2]|uniref:Allophanate hydrolase n=1 Tax=Pseudaquabacterium terrae TaxID=2732868 RepID=A0ABX2EHD2_9BURK|nr:allophanate hydrolase [Aquabacterium terrae]NRF68005.1 allophanate hydrolase [Aquabacterium terrae]